MSIIMRATHDSLSVVLNLDQTTANTLNIARYRDRLVQSTDPNATEDSVLARAIAGMRVQEMVRNRGRASRLRARLARDHARSQAAEPIMAGNVVSIRQGCRP